MFWFWIGPLGSRSLYCSVKIIKKRTIKPREVYKKHHQVFILLQSKAFQSPLYHYGIKKKDLYSWFAEREGTYKAWKRNPLFKIKLSSKREQAGESRGGYNPEEWRYDTIKFFNKQRYNPEDCHHPLVIKKRSKWVWRVKGCIFYCASTA